MCAALTWQNKAGARHGGSKDQPPGVGMKERHDSIEAASAAEAHHILGSYHHGMQEVGAVTIQYTLHVCSTT